MAALVRFRKIDAVFAMSAEAGQWPERGMSVS
ncbi:hypothetical protein EES41_28170 [Streptomyces sp. ADI95-16]|nr:hypothetical protein EES41_28170 [Streptomyces sp. ADI95-16]